MGYKLERYRRRQPAILILGSSRMLQARDRFFTKAPEAVYNAAGPGWGLPTIIQFYERLPQPPEIVLLGIDQFWFNADLPLSTAPDAALEADFGWDSIRQATVETTHRLLGGELTIAQILAGADPVYARRGLGLRALQSSFGYRADGSLQQGLLIESRQMQAAHVAAALTDFEDNVRFAPASRINQTALDLLADFSLGSKRMASWSLALRRRFTMSSSRRWRLAALIAILTRGRDRWRGYLLRTTITTIILRICANTASIAAGGMTAYI